MTHPDLHEVSLDEIDRDGAVAEATEALGATRGQLLRRGGLALGAGLAATALPVSVARAQGGLSRNDVEILNYALTLEYLEAAFYVDALRRARLRGEARRFAQVAGGHEAAHVRFLRQTLGSRAGARPRFDFGAATRSRRAFLNTAQAVEDLGVSAYQGQADRIDSDQVLAAAGSVLAVEARHAAWVRDIIGRGRRPVPAPRAFNDPQSMTQVLRTVTGTGFIQS